MPLPLLAICESAPLEAIHRCDNNLEETHQPNVAAPNISSASESPPGYDQPNSHKTGHAVKTEAPTVAYASTRHQSTTKEGPGTAVPYALDHNTTS